MPNNVTLASHATLRSTTLASGDPTSVALDVAATRRRIDLPVVLVGLVCAWWLIAVPREWGGRGGGVVTIGAVATGLATLAIRPHRYVRARMIWLALATSMAAVVVALVSPTGWAGASTAASYVAASWTVVCVAAAVVRDRRVVDFLLPLVSVGVLVEVAESWLAWWGGGNPGAPITGTFYWYNPFAAFMIAGSVIGLSCWLRHSGAIAALGMTSFVFGTVGLVYSTSRAADACFAVAVGFVIIAHPFTDRLRGAGRAVIALAVTGLATFVIAGPPFFAHRALPFAGTSARASGQSLGQNGGYRIDFWHEAIGVFARHPVAGGGYHSLGAESVGHVPSGWPISPLAHNGYLQVLSDGGLVLGVPFLLAAVGVCWWTVAALVGAVRARDFTPVGFALPLSLGALLVHSLVDFDWSYAADFLLVAILAGALGGSRPSGARPIRAGWMSRILAGAVLTGVGLTGVAAFAAWPGDLRQSLPITQSASHGETR